MVVRICQNCNKHFKMKSHYLEHINPNRKYPCIKVAQTGGNQNEINNLKEKILETEKRELLSRIEQMKEYHKKEIEYFEKENEYLKDQLEKERNKSSVNITNNHNTLYMVNYIMNNHTKSPPIEVKNDYLEILGEDSKEDLSKSIVVCNSLGRLYEYIGSYIVKKYKTVNAIDQNLFCTDISRDNYILKIIEEVNKKYIIKWIKDKGGVTFKNKIIKPMVDYICEVLQEEIMKKNNRDDIIKESLMLSKLTDALCTIKGKEFMGKLLKEVGPELQIRT